MPRRRAAILSAISLIVVVLAACGGGSDGGQGGTVAAGSSAAEGSATEVPVASGSRPSGATTVPTEATAPTVPAAAPTADTPPVVATPPAELGPVHRLVVRDLDGNEFPLSRLAGRPMIIEIWATWCGPCRKNRATVHSLLPTFPKRLAVVGISVDTGPDLVKNFLRSNTANEFELMATPEFMEFVRARNASPSIPKTMYVDSKGRVADLSEGTQSAKWLEAMARNLR
jgi:thiol-disulfide isomerase/thioredoxin